MKPFCRMFLLCAVLTAGPATAGVVIENAQNYVRLSVAADTSYDGVVIDTGPHGADEATAGPPSEPHPPYRNTVTASSFLLPASTLDAGKDQANGSVQMTFDPGEIGVADSFSIMFSGTASAISALASDGSPAAAHVTLVGIALFHLDSFGSTPGDFVGSLAIAALPAASSFEGFSVKVLDNALDVAFFSAGDPGGAVPLYAGHGYQITAKYQMLVPHGEDPPFSVTLAGSLVPAAPVPEPETYALMLAGLGLLGLAARRRADRAIA